MTEHNIAYARSQMPQVRLTDILDELDRLCIEYELETVNPEFVTPMQLDFDMAKVKRIRANAERTPPILVSNDYKIIDGHHRWKSHVLTSTPIKCVVVDLSAVMALAVAHSIWK